MLDQTTKQRMVAEETARFMDDTFGQLEPIWRNIPIALQSSGHSS